VDTVDIDDIGTAIGDEVLLTAVALTELIVVKPAEEISILNAPEVVVPDPVHIKLLGTSPPVV
jgi:hypothetical protein